MGTMIVCHMRLVMALLLVRLPELGRVMERRRRRRRRVGPKRYRGLRLLRLLFRLDTRIRSMEGRQGLDLDLGLGRLRRGWWDGVWVLGAPRVPVRE